MLSVFSTTFVLFFTIFLGMILGKTRIFDTGSDKVLIHFVFYIALPMQLFLSCYKSSLELFNPGYIASYFISMIIIIVITCFISIKFLKTSFAASALNTMSVTQIDGAYFTIPLFMLVFSSAAFAIPLMAIQNVIFFTFTVLIIELTSQNNKLASNTKFNSYTFILKRIIKVITTNPIIVSSILGFVLGATKVPLEKHLIDVLGFLGRTSAPVALFSLGLSCSFSFAHIRNFDESIIVIVLSIMKLILFPIVAVIIGLLFGLDHQLLLALALLTASPTATHNYIIANQYNLKAEIQTFVVVLTTILSFITINIWLFLLQ
ncbi:AEC family transporter [bacterium SCSIO 12844]|nr:AEC family transporter [bacterium SCSIO 12844]